MCPEMMIGVFLHSSQIPVIAMCLAGRAPKSDLRSDAASKSRQSVHRDESGTPM